MRNLSIAGKITVFKTVAMSKIVRLALVKLVPNSIILEFDKIKKHFIWEMAVLKLNRPPFVKIMKIKIS